MIFPNKADELFKEVDDLDAQIVEELRKIGAQQTRPTIVVCKIDLTNPTFFWFHQEQCGVYLIKKLVGDELAIYGIRTEVENGQNGGKIALKVIRDFVFKTLRITETPEIVEREYSAIGL